MRHLWFLLCVGMSCHESQPLPTRLQAAPASTSTPAAALVSEAKPPPPTRPTFNPKKQLLYDPKKAPAPPKPAAKGEEEALLDKLFPRRLKDLAGCRDAASREEALATGQLIASVSSWVDGFFTRNDLLQRAYLVEVRPCKEKEDAPAEDAPPNGYALVVTGHEPLALEFTSGGMGVLTVADVDQDGLHEVLLSTSIGGYGDPLVQLAMLYRYEGGRFVFKDGSWEVSDEGSSIYFQPTTPGEMPKIIGKRFR